MRRDILFFLKGIPREYRVYDRLYFMAAGDRSAEALVTQLREHFDEFDNFCRLRPTEPLLFLGVRNNLEETKDSIKDAYRKVLGLIDGYALILKEAPTISSLVLVREESSSDATIHRYQEGGWAHFGSPKTEGFQKWESRNKLLLQHILQFFDIVSGASPDDSEVSINLRYALRMYRSGVDSKVFGVEYLCKFSALECLVCGSETSGKENLLKTRIGALFDYDKIASGERISKLWQIRCEASHYARAFDDIEENPTRIVQPHIPDLERLFAGVVCFVIESRTLAQSIDDLWKNAEEFVIPELISDDRPPKIQKMSVCNYHQGPLGTIPKCGARFDEIYSKLSG